MGSLHRARPEAVVERAEMPSRAPYGPLASLRTIYELPDGRRGVVTFVSRDADVLTPIRNDRGELWLSLLLPGDVEPDHFDDWQRIWAAAELLRPAGELA